MAVLWPSMTEYSGAIQNAETSFRLSALAGAEFATLPMMGLPAFASGQNAVVFSASIGSNTTAVRCFTSPSQEGRRRYQALEQHLREQPVGAMVAASWIDDAIEVNGRLWPVVTMDWVDGVQLHEWVGANVGDAAALGRLAGEWVSTCTSLRTASVTHGDLQHGNVLVDSQGSIRLIDFDGVWLSEIADAPPTEVGHPNYQHPERSETGAWGWSIDWFSALGVLVALRALAADPALWELHNGENLIFHESDFWGDAEVWQRLERSPDREVADLSRLLAEGCAHRCDAPYDLPTILRRGLVDVEGPATHSQARHDHAQPNAHEHTANNTRPTNSTQWWAESEPKTNADDFETPRPRPDAPEPDPLNVNFVWVTGPRHLHDEAPSSPSGSGVRPPQRERPEEQEVRASWREQAGHASSPPPPGPRPHAGAPQPPPPRPGAAPPNAATPGPPPPVSHGDASSVLTYVLVIVAFLAIGVLLAIVAGG